MENFIKNKKLLSFIITIQESFIAIVPFFLLTSLISLYYNFVLYTDTSLFFINIDSLKSFKHILQSFTSLIAVISISYFFASRFKTSQVISIFLAITTYITIWLFDSEKIPNQILNMSYGFNANVLIMPILSTYLLKLFYPYFSLNITKNDGNYHIYSLFNYVFVFFVAYFATIAINMSVNYLVYSFLINFNPLNNDLPDIITLAIRNFMVDILWFFGIHGEHAINGIFGKEILFKHMYENLTYGEFNRIFVLLGGAGVGLGLLISLLLYAKEKTIRTIVSISIPFSIFNINTLLIYAIVVLNRFLILPFILLPLANLFIAYFALSLFHVDFTSYYVIWTTPTFIDSYLKTNGDLFVVYLQLYILFFDVLVYTYFVKKFLSSQCAYQHVEVLEKNLHITTELNSEKNIHSYIAQKDIIEANIKVEEIVNDLNEDKLFVYYQPKINIKEQKCEKFEALLRYKKDGKLVGPIFLDTLEKAGLAYIIDFWVCTRVKEDLVSWKEQNFYPNISVNLHPDTLKSKDIMEKIMIKLEGENIDFEIIERSFLYKSSEENLLLAKKNGFGISIDDFGTGYSSLETIVKHDINELKLDKSLIDIIHTDKGYKVCKHTSKLCHDLKYTVVAEGIETKEQLDLAKQIDVDLIQGYYFSKAMPFDEVLDFKYKFEEEIN